MSNFYGRFLNRYAKRYIGYVVGVVLGGLLWACQPRNEVIKPSADASTVDASVALQWMDLFLKIEQYAPGYRPPVAARTLGYIGLAAYETIVPASATYQSIATKLPGLSVPTIDAGKSYRWDIALNEVYYLTMKGFFPHITDVDKAKIENLYKSLLTNAVGTFDELDRSK